MVIQKSLWVEREEPGATTRDATSDEGNKMTPGTSIMLLPARAMRTDQFCKLRK